MTYLCILLLALPAWGQAPAKEACEWLMEMRPQWSPIPGSMETITFTVPAPTYEWVTVLVDSLNPGKDSTACKRECPRMHALGLLCVGHDWVYGEPYCSGEAGPGFEHIYDPDIYDRCQAGDRQLRERICRACLRHEWQERRAVPPPKSEFEELREQLR